MIRISLVSVVYINLTKRDDREMMKSIEAIASVFIHNPDTAQLPSNANWHLFYLHDADH